MPRAVSLPSGKPYLGKTKAAAQRQKKQFIKANREFVLQGAGTVLKYRIQKVKGGYGIYYTKTGRWRGDASLRELGLKKTPSTLRRRKR